MSGSSPTDVPRASATAFAITAGTATVPGAGSVVQWDRQRALALFEALKRDQPVDGLVDQPAG